jgi:predicted kinase
MSNKLVLIRGLPGSGKSTAARQYFNDCIHLEADMYFTSPQGEYIYDASKIKQAHAWCQESTRIFLNNNKNVVVSNTFTTRKELDFYITYANENNIPYVVFRMKNNYGSIHNVPQEAINRMSLRFEDVEKEILW